MKIKKLISIAGLLFAATLSQNVDAAISPENFPYEYLGKNQFCEGVEPKIIHIGGVGAADSRNPLPLDEIWYPGIEVVIFKGGSLGGFEQMPKLAFTPDIEGDISNYLKSSINTDLVIEKSLSSIMDSAISFMERKSVRGAVIEICMNRFDIIDLDQDNYETFIRYGLGFDIYLVINSIDGQEKLLVQNLGGEVKTKGFYRPMYQDRVPQPAALFEDSWNSVNWEFSQFLKPVWNEEAQKNLIAIKIELGWM